MYSPLPPLWDHYIRSGAQRISRMDIVANPAIGYVTVADVPISSWSGTVSRRSDIRRTANAQVVDADLLARLVDPATSLRPFSAEVVIKHGFLVNGIEHLIPFGRFQVEELGWNEDESSFTMSLNDRSKALQRASFGVIYDASGKTLFSIINDLVLDALPYVQINIHPDVQNFRVPGGTTYRAGKLAAIHEACAAAGAEFYFDADGVAQVIPVPYLDTVNGPGPADWGVDVGPEGVMISYQRTFSRKDAFNKVHVYGANPAQDQPQSYDFALDDNPASPTFYGGPFGKADIRIERQELTTNGQCRTYALAYLRNAIGLPKSIDMSSLSNIALSEGDIILATFPDDTEEYHMVDGFDIDESGKMDIKTRTDGNQ